MLLNARPTANIQSVVGEPTKFPDSALGGRALFPLRGHLGSDFQRVTLRQQPAAGCRGPLTVF